MNQNLRKCSRCHSKKLESLFGINAKGERQKTCKNCRNPKMKLDDIRDKIIEIERHMFIKDTIEEFGDNIEYVCPYTPDDTPEDIKLTGTELLVEYHLFRIKNTTKTIYKCWIVKDPTNECMTEVRVIR